MVYLNSAFSFFLGILSSFGALATFPEEVETQFANIDKSVRDFLEQVDVVKVALPFFNPEAGCIETSVVGNQIEESMSIIRPLITEEDQFASVLTRLSDMLNRNLWDAASNIEDKEKALYEATARLEVLEERMESLENTDVMYGLYLHMRCGVIDFMNALGGANSAWNESNEALEMLNRDVDLMLNNRFFASTSAFIRGENLSEPTFLNIIKGQIVRVSFGNILFALNYLWKLRRVGTQPAAGHFDPSLPSWSAFYSLEGPQRPPTRLENIRAADNGIDINGYESFCRGLLRETGREDALTCVICLEDMEEAEAKLIPCLHGFHIYCIQQWMFNENKCPVCRHPATHMLV